MAEVLLEEARAVGAVPVRGGVGRIGIVEAFSHTQRPAGSGVSAMARPVIGVIGNARLIEGRFPAQIVGERNLHAVAEVAEALPLVFAGTPGVTGIGDLLDAVDGVLLTGGRANVHPAHFGFSPHPAHEPYDEARDDLALPLIRECVARGVPLFGICRGLQEMNVAFGGTLHPEIRELPGRLNHRMPRLPDGEIHPDLAVIYADRHEVRLTPGGAFARLLDRERIRVNSLHGQGILELGPRVVMEGIAEDKTIEAIRILDAPGFALGVQWHAEYDPGDQPDQPRAVPGVRGGRGGAQGGVRRGVMRCRPLRSSPGSPTLERTIGRPRRRTSRGREPHPGDGPPDVSRCRADESQPDIDGRVFS